MRNTSIINVCSVKKRTQYNRCFKWTGFFKNASTHFPPPIITKKHSLSIRRRKRSHKSMLFGASPNLFHPPIKILKNHWFEKDSFKKIKDLELKSHPPIWRGPHQNSSISPNFGIAQDPLKWPNAAPPSIQSLHPRCRPCRHVCHLYLGAKANIAPENVAIPKISSSSNNNWFSGAMSYCIC